MFRFFLAIVFWVGGVIALAQWLNGRPPHFGLICALFWIIAMRLTFVRPSRVWTDFRLYGWLWRIFR